MCYHCLKWEKVAYFLILFSKYSRMHHPSHCPTFNKIKSSNRSNYSPELGFYCVGFPLWQLCLSEYLKVLSVAVVCCIDYYMNL